MRECVYLLGKFGDECDIQYVVIGPEGLDLQALEEPFEREHDLWYPPWRIPPPGLSPREYLNAWREWADGYDAFVTTSRPRRLEATRLMADWLVRHHGCRRVPHQLMEL